MLVIEEIKYNNYAAEFCNEFVNCTDKPKIIFGRNEFAESISRYIEIDGYVDEYTNEEIYLGKPVLKLDQVPENALVVSVVVIGRPLTAEKKIKQLGLRYLDYFSFYKYSNLPVKQVVFWDNFQQDLEINFSKYQTIYSKLKDLESKEILYRIVNFRNSYNLDFMRKFTFKEDKQYFEDFLDLKEKGEAFVDVGGFDGHTSFEFIKRCPEYSEIIFFEPEEKNLNVAKDKLKGHSNIIFNKFGLSNKKQILKFDISGSSSKISDSGAIEIEVVRLDDVVHKSVTFIKMDIEGAEKDAIEGSYNVIKKYHPKLAICVYHKPEDLWAIPEQILNIRDDYDIYLRHYNEGISETVMFFIPKT